MEILFKSNELRDLLGPKFWPTKETSGYFMHERGSVPFYQIVKYDKVGDIRNTITYILIIKVRKKIGFLYVLEVKFMHHLFF